MRILGWVRSIGGMTTTTWKRTPFGYLSPDGEVFVERGAPMVGGGTAWLVWFKAHPGEVERSRFSAWGPSGEPVRTLAELAYGDYCPVSGPEFIHLNDAGSAT